MIKNVTSFLFIIIIFFSSIYVMVNIHLPYCTSIVEKVKSINEQHKVAEDTMSISAALSKKKNDINKVDSLLQLQMFRESEVKNGIVESLYLFADSADLKASKVEVGEKLSINNRYETSISINGTGSYLSIGKFIENIENYPKSTRVRQVVLKSEGKKDIEAFIDFVLME